MSGTAQLSESPTLAQTFQPVQDLVIGQGVKLRVAFRDEEGNPADPDVSVTFILIDHDNEEVVNVTEAIGSLSTIQREGSVGGGVFFYRHVATSGDSTRDETWEYKWKCSSSGGAVAAFGQFIIQGPPSYTDGQAFTLDDGVNTPVRFEFDNNAIVQAGSVVIDLTAAVDADALAGLVRTAINGASLDITASGSGSIVDLVNDTPGSHGNTPVTLEGSPPGSFTSMGGGRPPAPITAARRSFRVLASDFPTP